MSNIFYSEVDPKLQQELNARGYSGFRRNSDDIAYMTEKIANVQLEAYGPPRSGSKEAFGPIMPSDKFPILGGQTVLSDRYQPSGKNGFLNSQQETYTKNVIEITGTGNDLTATSVPTLPLTDNSRRIGPYIRTADVSIGDGSMGLLNKATVAITVPNPTRDLDAIESTWMRPGRHVTITLEHPESAVITKNKSIDGYPPTNALLSKLVIPDKSKLQELYPSWNIDDLQNRIRSMNKYTFTGLITNFDLSYATDASAEITISLTGTSDIYTDITLLMDPKKDEKSQLSNTENIELNKTISEFYETLSAEVDIKLRPKFKTITGLDTGIMPFTIENEPSVNNTDRFILFGQPFNTNISRPDFESVYEPFDAFEYDPGPGQTEADRPNPADPQFRLPGSLLPNVVAFDSASQEYEDRIDTEFNEQVARFESASRLDKATEKTIWEEEEGKIKTILTDDNRYITLGGLIYFINTQVASKQQGIGILHDDIQVSSTYYKYLKSNDPENVLLLPKDPSIPGDMNWYGETGYYEDVVNFTNMESSELQEKSLYQSWPGVYQQGGSPLSSKILPSRIFINLAKIDEIIDLLNGDKSTFKIGKFLETISALINNATAGAINLVLTELKDDPTKVIYADAGYIDRESVIPYSVPMFANHPNGTIVHDFQLSAKLPSSVKNLSYVLNQGPDISTEKIAPYMNFMFNADNPDVLNTIIDNYKLTHNLAVQKLSAAAVKYGLSPQDSETSIDLKTALQEYLKHPSADIRQSQQLTAPIFPFDASFKIDGVNGLRYGDVLTFDSLPKKYTANTVFSIIGINHTVGTDGMWTTKVTCIMRPNID